MTGHNQKHGKDNPRYNRVTFNCDYCGKETVRHKAAYDSHKNHFCCHKCSSDYGVIMRPSPEAKTNKIITFKCDYCGRDKERSVKEYERTDKHYCSKKCAAAANIRLNSGENHYAWAGGITKIYRAVRREIRTTAWRLDIMRRDTFKCWGCGIHNAELQVHHIKSVRQIILDNNITAGAQALDCAELWDTDNGLTLCKLCHKQVHKNGYANS